MEVVVALLMFMNHEIKEHRIQDSMSMCLKGKREAERQISINVQYKCIRTKAELETNPQVLNRMDQGQPRNGPGSFGGQARGPVAPFGRR